MIRATVIAVAYLLPSIASACSNGYMYDLSFANAMPFVFFAWLGLVVAVALRALRGALGLRLPIAVGVISAVLPVLEWLRWGNGDCGHGFVDATQYCATVVALYFTYELAMLYNAKRAERLSGDT